MAWILAACSPRVGPASITRNLEPGKAISTTHDPADSVDYIFESKPGHTYLIRVGQDSADVTVKIEDSVASTITVDTWPAASSPEFVLLEPPLNSPLRISVFSHGASEPEISHDILVSDLGPDFEGSESNVTAARLMSSATVNYWVHWDWNQAADNASQAAELYGRTGYAEHQADALMFQAAAMAETIYSVEDRDSVLDEIAALLNKSFDAHSKLGNIAQLAKVRYYNGLSLQYAGRNNLARTFYDESLSLYARTDDWPEQRKIQLNLAVMEITSGDSASAIRSLNELLRIDGERTQGSPDKNFVATVLDQLGFAYADIGDIDAALWAYFSAAEKHADVGDQHGAAESMKGLAHTYLNAGDIDAARQFIERARLAANESSNGRILSGLLSMLGNALYSTEDFESAREVQIEALTLAAPDSAVRASRQVDLARTLNALREHAQAEKTADDALRASRAVNALLSEAGALRELGRARFELGKLSESVHALEEGLEIYESLGRSTEQADVSHLLALSLTQLASNSDNPGSRSALFEEAKIMSEAAIQHLEWAIAKVSDPELRSRLGARHRTYFRSHVELMMDLFDMSGRNDMQYVSAALTTSEQARARMTMNLLNEASVDLYESVDPDIAEHMNSLLKRLAVRERQHDELQESGANNSVINAKLASLRDEIASIRVQYDLAQVALRKNNNAYRALAAPETIGIDRIQDLVDENSIVIQYFLGEQKSFAWIVAHDSVDVVRLADRATIEDAATQAFSDLSQADLRRNAGAELSPAVRDVSALVLEPLAPLIGNRRLVIVADGALHYLPFQALSLLSDDREQRLVQTHEVAALPSISVLAALRARKSVDREQGTVAVFADPVFDRSDPRYLAISDDVQEGAWRESTLGPKQFSRLIGTHEEARAIAELVPAEKLLMQTGFAANRDSLLDRDLSDYQYVHLATHGSVDRASPELSSIVLSQFDEDGIPEDGFLRLPDIYRLKIDADLVVLSACKTGSGVDIDGEGLVGLAQGIFYAGARRMVVSLWDVPDKPTSVLMKAFYSEIFEKRRTPIAALRAAQLAVAADMRWAHPYYWSAFILLGDWQ